MSPLGKSRAPRATRARHASPSHQRRVQRTEREGVATARLPLAGALAGCLVMSTTLSLGGCGSRTGLSLEQQVEATPPPEQCLFDEDCVSSDLCQPTVCVAGSCQQVPEPLSCDDDDECTVDRCDPRTGSCVFDPLSFDRDGDGFLGPRAGFVPGSSGACGDDCDDTSELAFPGGTELCDGVDNDCNGVIDDGAQYNLVSDEPLRLSRPEDSRSSPRGLTFDGERWAATLWGEDERREFRVLGITPDGTIEFDKAVTNHNGGSYGGPIAWTGSLHGVAWSDNRQGETVEVYFNRLDRNGDKLGPDLRLTQTSELSRGAFLRYNGSEFVVFWDDTLNRTTSLYGQRITLDGETVGEARRVTPAGLHAEFASMDFGQTRVGVLFESSNDAGDRTLNFMTTDHGFEGDPTLVSVDTDPDSHHIAFASDRFIAVWSQQFPGQLIGETVYGATFDEQGNPLEAKTALTPGGANTRGGSLLSLGDRSLLFWSDDREGNYELYVKTIDNELNELTPPQRLTFADGYSLGAKAAFGPDSQVGVLFTDSRDGGAGHAYMLRLSCATTPGP